MQLLLIDTSGSEGSIALADTDQSASIVTSETLPGRSASEQLVPAVRRALARSNWKLQGLAAIAVVHGPGSFTGIRVGVSAAKGFSEAAGVPLIAVSRLALLAAKGGNGLVHAVLDAGRGEFYYGKYFEGKSLREELLSGEEVRNSTGNEKIITCEARVADALADLNPLIVQEPKAEDMLSIAVHRAKAGNFDDAALLDANYLRRTDSELFAKSKSATR
ncbi:MAG TPA: tRNA (adenosine(37)-N6)-threonylcarbamoyltransferase complex dimerization subunit type 1 TsaB [Edaphobacter sp.]|nr:tRNA (adenosine(37)-N6)-threonylcarbamoyltransferase complex dimerization subunit type 1 TsaB [Edaphobacter sp.]